MIGRLKIDYMRTDVIKKLELMKVCPWRKKYTETYTDKFHDMLYNKNDKLSKRRNVKV